MRGVIIKTELYMKLAAAIAHRASADIEEAAGDPIGSRVLSLMLHHIATASDTVGDLVRLEKIENLKEQLVIARGIVESCINVSFIIAKGPEYTKKAYDHALQRTVRANTRRETIGEWTFETTWSGASEFIEQPGVKEAMDQYKPSENWTGDRIREKAEFIATNTGLGAGLIGIYYSLYAKASEVSHGSYYGISNFYGINRPTGHSDRLEYHQITLLSFCALAILETTMIYASLLGRTEIYNDTSATQKSLTSFLQTELEKLNFTSDN